MPTRIVRAMGRDYEVIQVGEIQKVLCRELRLLEPGPELEGVLRQMEAEDDFKRRQAEEKKANPDPPPPHRGAKRRKDRRNRKGKHRS